MSAATGGSTTTTETTTQATTEATTGTSTTGTIDDGELAGLAQRLGIDGFRPSQREAIGALVEGTDVLAIIPTGGGKSAIYQAVSELLDGPTVVVSPLLALQEDQLASIASADLGEARAIDGSSSEADRAEVLDGLADGTLRYLFATPEILRDDELLDRLAEVGVSLLAVDEAHCVVTWGEGFRPDFAELGDVRRRLGSPTTVALTGSADPRIRADVCRSLAMDDVRLVTSGLERSNITLSVVGAASSDDAVDDLVAHLDDVDGKALVYVPTRKLTVEIAERVAASGRPARAFHGGLAKAEKTAALEMIRSEERAVVVATTAFGMGIDVPDIASVVHLDMPDSLLAYYQEVGRGGRDGGAASGAVFVSLRTKSRRAFASGVRATSVVDCASVDAALRAGASSRAELRRQTGLPAGRVARALAVLVEAGVATTTPALAVVGASDPDLIDRLCRAREEFDRSQLQAVERYRSARHCRWAQILASLGEPLDRCGHCDVCEAEAADGGSAQVVDGPFPVGAIVEHDEFGRGCVTSRRADVIDVAFDEVGPKGLSAELCLEEGLIRSVDAD